MQCETTAHLLELAEDEVAAVAKDVVVRNSLELRDLVPQLSQKVAGRREERYWSCARWHVGPQDEPLGS